ncbi:MAG: hypothetical protein Q9174_004710 [Haloplaca sp. 1 TL-2023]
MPCVPTRKASDRRFDFHILLLNKSLGSRAMDHIPLPKNCRFSQIRVPCLVGSDFSCRDWRTYPQLHGWQVERLAGRAEIKLRGERRPIEETAAFLQSWLYFGLLAEFLEDHFVLESFVHHDVDGKRTISTVELDKALGRWSVDCNEKADLLAMADRLQDLHSLLIEHRNVCMSIHDTNDALGDPSIIVSIAVLSEGLAAAITNVLSHSQLETPVKQTWRLRTSDFVDVGQPILDAMQSHGWCPYDLKRLSSQMAEVSVLYYYSNLPPPRASKGHGGCSDVSCLAMTTNPRTYKPSHCVPDCQCPLLHANPEEVAQILRRGALPVVVLTLDPTSKAPKITLQDAATLQGFVAISHVWAEGAGNVSGNALQSCLLLSILELVKKLPWKAGETAFAFWIDTLCVPVAPTDLHKMALNHMRVPYEQAEQVLVLDAHLRSLNSSELEATEIFAQVSCSSWMRRLWTLQEGKLARRVWFQFADQAVDVKGIFERLNHRLVPSRIDYRMQVNMYSQLWAHIWHRDNAIKGIGTAGALIASNRMALASRSVSVPSDEGLCLFTLMGFDMTEVTAVPASDRMALLWRKFSRVPLGFLFSKATRKMPHQGLHWAPASFLGLQRNEEWSGPRDLIDPGENDPHAIPTSSGLRAALPGFKLDPNLLSRMGQLGFEWDFALPSRDEAGAWYLIRPEEPWRQAHDIAHASGQLAIILPHQLLDDGARYRHLGHPPSEFEYQDSAGGILVSVVKAQDDIIHVIAHNHVMAARCGEGIQTLRCRAKECANAMSLPLSIIIDESFDELKGRYESVAQSMLREPDVFELLARKARYYGKDDDYDALLDDFLDSVVVAACFGDICKMQKVDKDQQWCVD